MEAAAADLRYPVGKFKGEGNLSYAQRENMINEIAGAPPRLREAVARLSDAQLDTPYREGGWTVRQVVHHLADSHMSAYVRIRLALTENGPQIKTYDQTKWAELADARTAPVELSLGLLERLHERWALLLRSLDAADFSRTINHPERGAMTIDQNIELYAWHGRHHVGHITSLRMRMGWK
ncbi:MAG: putative metal-dependent hydrolase [Acidobacteriota bacterium]|nr:putative metal-dependent hydrolase [Acidobacteriota bacterium]